MPPVEKALTAIGAGHLEGAAAVIGLWIVLKAVDYGLQRAFNQRVFATAYAWVKRQFNIYRTKLQTISADYEFSLYTHPEVTLQEARENFRELTDTVENVSNGEFSEKSVHWGRDKNDAQVKFTQEGREETYTVELQFIPDTAQMDPGDPVDNAPLSSIGVSIEFDFEFKDLEPAIIDLGTFVDHLYDSFATVYPVREITNGKFVVQPVDQALTLDEWVEKERFDVSLLLESDDGKRSVKFFGDRAEITTPNKRIDRKSAEYIRETLLNYYL